MLKNRMSLSADSRFTHHIQPNVVLFPFMYYPFPNGIVTYEYFKTILSCQANQQTIKKIMKIKLQSMISIKKVIKTKKKQNILLNVKLIDQNKNSPNQAEKIENFYSFYYEIIPFSLISIIKGQAGHCSQALLKKFDRVFIKKQITKLVSDLQKIGVFYLIKLQNIGVTLTGNIKAYVAPNILFGNIKLTQNQKVVILKNLIRTLKQIDSKFIKKSKKTIEQCSIEKILPDEFSTQMNMLKTQNLQKGQINNNSSIFIIKNQQRSFGQQQQNFIRHPGSTNNIQLKMQQKNKQQFKKNKFMGRSQQSITSSKDLFSLNIMNVKQQKKKIQQITKEIEQIRKKIKQKAQAKKVKQKGLVQEYPTNVKENQTIKKSPLKSSRNNLAINLIQKQLNKNIIQEQIQVQTKIKKKRKSSQSSINFYQGQIPTQNNINCINIYHHGPNMNSHSIYLDNDTVSCDTYQMEIGRDHQMPKIKPNNNNGFRNTLTPNKRHLQKAEQELNSQQAHSHVQKKPFYQSAGNKMFSHIVNNLIKPQFMPKKSNIYEDPQEQNEKSVSIRKSNKIQKKDQKQEQKNPNNKIKTVQNKVIENLIKNLSDSKKDQKDNLNRMKSLDQFKMHINGLKSMKKLSITKQQQKNTLQLKVKNVLQKTKNAIAMLNKVKSKFKPSSSSIQKNNIASIFK